MATGTLGEIGHSSDWTRITAHPDSKESFHNKKIPAFGECVKTITSLHKKVPFARVIGWDVTVDAAGSPRVMEWNGAHNDIKYSEATQGPCFADLIAETKALQAPR